MLGRSDFLGRWRLSRQIADSHADQQGTLTGTATMRADGTHGLIYDEVGTFQLGQGAPMQATRRYLWTFGASEVTVTFANGDAFHSFVPVGQSAGSDHLCGADMYKVRYDFTAWPNWSARWAVQGPAKDYVMLTNYSRD